MTLNWNRFLAEAQSRVGMEMRSCHPGAPKSREWAEILYVGRWDNRWYYFLLWPDGVNDFWPIVDSMADYEFRGEPLVFIEHDEHDELDEELSFEGNDSGTTVGSASSRAPAPAEDPLIAAHRWELVHALNRHNIPIANKMRVVCGCDWRSIWVDEPAKAVELHAEHLELHRRYGAAPWR